MHPILSVALFGGLAITIRAIPTFVMLRTNLSMVFLLLALSKLARPNLVALVVPVGNLTLP